MEKYFEGSDVRAGLDRVSVLVFHVAAPQHRQVECLENTVGEHDEGNAGDHV